MNKFCELADIQWLSKTTFYNYQHTHIIPTISEHFEASLKESRENMLTKGELVYSK